MTIICLFYLCTCLRVPIVIWYYNRIKKRVAKYKEKDYTEFWILLPALREQKLVKETIEYFNNLNYNANKLHICLITTQKEEFEYNQKNQTIKTTRDVVLSYLKENKTKYNTYLIHYPKEKGNKASQLNYAIKKITESSNKDCYFVIFDFDSRPNTDFLITTNKTIELYNQPDLLQPIPFFLKNAEKLSTNIKNTPIIIHGMEQSCRSGCIEIWNLMMNSCKLPLSPIYAMGACLCIKKSALIEQDYIPEPVDDLPLGFRYFINKKNFHLVPSIVLGDLPDTMKKVLNQSILIQKGNLLAIKEITRKGTAKHNLWRRLLILWEFLTVFFSKTILPYFLLLFAIFNIVNFHFISIIIISLPFFRYLAGVIIMRKLACQKIKLKTFILGFFLCFISPFCLTYGPIKNIQLEIKKKLKKVDISYKKTER